jgi:superfamily II DNA/RNA helicase
LHLTEDTSRTAEPVTETNQEAAMMAVADPSAARPEAELAAAAPEMAAVAVVAVAEAQAAATEPVATEAVVAGALAAGALAAEALAAGALTEQPLAQPDAADAPEGEAEGEAEEEAGADEPEEDAAPRATFADLGLSDELVRAVSEAGYLYPTPIQEQAIPVVLMNRDVLGCAQTGTGKTASFVLPMLDILSGSRAKARMPRSLILEPTRELALQVAENFVKYGKYLNLNHALLIGGESMDEQKRVLNEGVDVLIATPGRLLDMFDRGRILMADCKLLVIDEADRMLDMGFIPDVERIVGMLPPTRQTLFFSATMAPEIRRLADAFLQNPREITVSRPASVATTITSGLVYVQPHDKREALRRLIRSEEVGNALIFCNRKIEVDILYKSLKKHGFRVGALHGDLDQSVRFSTLNAFKANELQLLVCSDVAARGIDIGGLSHVFNFDVPFHSEDYVHRIGRTGRAGREGRAFSIATADDARNVAGIEKLIGQPLPRIVIPGLDTIADEDIAEALTRPRGRGRGGAARAPGRSSERGGRGGDRPREERGPRGRPERGERDRSERDRGERPAREDRPAREERPRRETAPVVAAEELAEAPRHRREDRPRGREGEPRRDVEPRRDDRARGRDDRPRRRDDDLGPAVRGFGDSIPAFMLIAIPKPRRDRAAEIEAELLPPPAMAAEIIAEPMADSAAPHVMAQAPTEAG